MPYYNVVEKFVSINGEGTKAGELAVFIRFKGCNLECSYCDTQWANQQDVQCEKMTEDDIYNYIKRTGVHNVTLTGGEPLYREHMDILIQRLEEDPVLQIEIETNGSIDLKSYYSISEKISFTMDYKLEGSYMEEWMDKNNFSILGKKDAVKFVVGSRNDLEKAEYIIEKYKLKERVTIYLSPVFQKITPKEIVEYMIERNLNYVRLQIQLHKIIWEVNQRGV